MKKYALIALLSVGFVGCAHQTKTETLAQFDEGIQTVERNPAADCLDRSNSNCKNARRNDSADQYILDSAGNLYRYFANAQQKKCQITNNVSDFKISQHPNDSAVIYFERQGDLWVVHPQGTSGNCPPVSKKVIMAGVKEWKMVSNTNTTIVNAALSNNGQLLAWDNVNVVYQENGIRDFQMNTCFGTAGRSFSSYAIFAQDHNRDIVKVKGQGGRYVRDAVEQGNFSSITEWKQSRNVCN